jgi:hypothetical protein
MHGVEHCNLGYFVSFTFMCCIYIYLATCIIVRTTLKADDMMQVINFIKLLSP